MKQQSCIFYLLFFIATFIVAWFYNFQPDYEYSWYWMFFHGGLIIPNWIYSWFTESKMCKPELYTTGYNVFWWISVIGMGISIIVNIFSFIFNFVIAFQQAKSNNN